MSTRMERYNNEDLESDVPSRVVRNNTLYQSIKSNELSSVRSDNNVKVIESNGKTIDIAKIKRYIMENNPNNTRNVRKSVVIEDNEEVVSQNENEEPKDYDLLSVLDKAKKNREVDYESERYRKLRDSEYDILEKIKKYEVNTEKEDLKEDFNTEERSLINLINTVTIHKGDLGLLDELMGEGESTLPIEEEKEKNDILKTTEENTNEPPKVTEIKNVEALEKTKELVGLKEKMIDDSFYTNSMTFDKKDFEGFEELEKSVKKNGVLSTIMIILLVIFIIVTLVVMANYVFKLGLF